MVILFIAIAFSIANSFLMVIYERIHELGIMMANGILPKKIRRILYTEAFFITLIGTMTGFLISAGILGYLGHNGLDLSAFAQGLGKFGVGSLVYPEIAAIDVILGLLVINVVVFLSVLYPAIKASRFEVVEAIRFE
ncbi:MAG: ABC transporter permease [bacterium]